MWNAEWGMYSKSNNAKYNDEKVVSTTLDPNILDFKTGTTNTFLLFISHQILWAESTYM